MFGCDRLAAACASRRKRYTNSSSPVNCERKILIDTLRFKIASFALYTTAIPPPPRRSMTSYRLLNLRPIMKHHLVLGIQVHFELKQLSHYHGRRVLMQVELMYLLYHLTKCLLLRFAPLPVYLHEWSAHLNKGVKLVRYTIHLV